MTTPHRASPDDRAFARAFEGCEIAPGAFDHAAHVRLAYVYLCELTVEEAVERMKEALLAFLAHLGADPGKYHETLTHAWIRAVRHFMEGSERCDSADAFTRRNPRLLDKTILLRHYSAEVLFSPEAGRRFVDPDVSPIPEHR